MVTGLGFELGSGIRVGVLTGGPSWQCGGESGSQGRQTQEGMPWNGPRASLPSWVSVRRTRYGVPLNVS